VLRKLGWQTRFLVSKTAAEWADWIKNEGHDVGVMEFVGSVTQTHVDHRSWDWRGDSLATRDLLSGARPDWLVVDHYGLGSAWEAELRSSTNRIMVIDDLANREHDCDLLLDQNPKHPEIYRDLLPVRTMKAIGPRYALIRPKFLAFRRERNSGSIRKLNLFMGGTDPSRSVPFILKELAQCQFNQMRIDVVVGSKSPALPEVNRLVELVPTASLYVDTDQMPSLFGAADLAIGAGGIAALERCSVGLPAITISVAANQEAGLTYIGEQGAAIYLGPSSRVQKGQVTECLRGLLNDTNRLQLMSERALSLVDGQGVARVARWLQ
jgi:UDP-2,4-diacetamido-2,4,6-trideoxy-beta-L-altropyranose hydrolase